MKKKIITPAVAFFALLCSLVLIYFFLAKLPPNLQQCLQKQKEIYKPGWEGEPTRQTNKCEKFAFETNDASLLDQLADSNDTPTVVAVAKNQNVGSPTLTKIYKRKFEEKWKDRIYWNLASNLNTDPTTLDELSKISDSEYDTTKLNVAKNPSTGANTLAYLFDNYKKHNVLSALAKNSNAPPDLLRSIENEVANIKEFPFMGEDEIHTHLASNPNTPKDVLIKLLREKGSTSVIWNFKDNIVRIDKEILELEDWYKNNVKSEKYKYGESQYHRLIYDLAKNPKTSTETLKIILERYRDLTNVSYGYSVKTFWGSKSISETIPEAAKKNLDLRK